MGIFSHDEDWCNYESQYKETAERVKRLEDYVDTLKGILADLCIADIIDLAHIMDTEAYKHTAYNTQQDIVYSIDSRLQDYEANKVFED